jgi:hypothetical protein
LDPKQVTVPSGVVYILSERLRMAIWIPGVPRQGAHLTFLRPAGRHDFSLRCETLLALLADR